MKRTLKFRHQKFQIQYCDNKDIYKTENGFFPSFLTVTDQEKQ